MGQIFKRKYQKVWAVRQLVKAFQMEILFNNREHVKNFIRQAREPVCVCINLNRGIWSTRQQVCLKFHHLQDIQFSSG